MFTSTNVNMQDVYLTYRKSIVPISSHYRCKASTLAKPHLPSISTAWKPLYICKSYLLSVSTVWKPLCIYKPYLLSVLTVWKPLCIWNLTFRVFRQYGSRYTHAKSHQVYLLVRDIVSHIVELMSIYTDISLSEVNQGANTHAVTEYDSAHVSCWHQLS